MGYYFTKCTVCENLHTWWSGNPDQRCYKCKSLDADMSLATIYLKVHLFDVDQTQADFDFMKEQIVCELLHGDDLDLNENQIESRSED